MLFVCCFLIRIQGDTPNPLRSTLGLVIESMKFDTLSFQKRQKRPGKKRFKVTKIAFEKILLIENVL